VKEIIFLRGLPLMQEDSIMIKKFFIDINHNLIKNFLDQSIKELENNELISSQLKTKKINVFDFKKLKIEKKQ